MKLPRPGGWLNDLVILFAVAALIALVLSLFP
jgi:hypothetical protein